MPSEYVCETPGCGAVIRKILGLHRFGEPMVWKDDDGEFVQCPRCQARIPWPPPELRAQIEGN
jgi:hypothetical protein